MRSKSFGSRLDAKLRSMKITRPNLGCVQIGNCVLDVLGFQFVIVRQVVYRITSLKATVKYRDADSGSRYGWHARRKARLDSYDLALRFVGDKWIKGRWISYSVAIDTI